MANAPKKTKEGCKKTPCMLYLAVRRIAFFTLYFQQDFLLAKATTVA
jgi:hypothetical protein